ncbi:MAG: antibiotic biosynthesis monooxygenase, partial [Blastocatellia bacterium]
MNNTSAQSEGPVTTIISRKVRAGHEDEYEAWLSGIVQAARAFPGYLGVNVMRPSSKAKPEYVTIVRFESYASLKHWENSDAQKEWQKKLPRDAVESEAQTRNMSGLEFWFTAADAPQLAQPPRYK